MLFAEDPQRWAGWTIDILGTDVSSHCVDRARAGTYTQFEVQRGLGINQMIKWFEVAAAAEKAEPQTVTTPAPSKWWARPTRGARSSR